LAETFNLDQTDWFAPDASVKTLADRAGAYRAQFKTTDGLRDVGLPLLVHRRCESPMFEISNHMAYDGVMVSRVPASDGGLVRAALGPSKWFDVQSPAQTKYAPMEGDALVTILHTLAGSGVTADKIFIITPFRIVALELRRRLSREQGLLSTLRITAKAFRQQIGTVHTFQGKEADTVFFVLGAPVTTQAGARRWAGSQPNIVNVAVSRAKRNFYVIGSHTAWAREGYVEYVAHHLPVQIWQEP